MTWKRLAETGKHQNRRDKILRFFASFFLSLCFSHEFETQGFELMTMGMNKIVDMAGNPCQVKI
jgi:hypothetical protein